MAGDAAGPTIKARLSLFVKNNIVTLVMVPAIITIHWGWSKLQNVDRFVSKEDRRELPVIQV